jgi:hypothetical protein
MVDVGPFRMLSSRIPLPGFKKAKKYKTQSVFVLLLHLLLQRGKTQWTVTTTTSTNAVPTSDPWHMLFCWPGSDMSHENKG